MRSAQSKVARCVATPTNALGCHFQTSSVGPGLFCLRLMYSPQPEKPFFFQVSPHQGFHLETMERPLSPSGSDGDGSCSDSSTCEKETWNLSDLAQSVMSELQHSDAPKSDVTFLVGQARTEVKAHRLIMAAHSNVMRTMFYAAAGEAGTGNWKESENDQVTLPECDPEVFIDFVNYSYSGQLSISTSSVCRLIELLDFLDARQSLVDKCSEWAERHLDLSTVCEYLKVSGRLRHRVESLYCACMEWIEDNAIDAIDNGVFNEVPLEELVALAQSNDLCADEMDLFEALRDRQNASSERSASGIPFEHVQLAVMTLEQLSGTVKESGVYDQQLLSELTFARLQGEFSCDPEKLRSPREPAWRWEVEGINSTVTLSTNILRIANPVTTANVVSFSALPHFDHAHCNKNGYRVAVFNTTPSLRMTVTFHVPGPGTTVRPQQTTGFVGFTQTATQTFSHSLAQSSTPALHFSSGPGTTVEKIRTVSIEVSHQRISLRGSSMGSAQFSCPVKRDFLLDICHEISNDSKSAVHIQINGFHSTAFVAARWKDIKWKIEACDPNLKLCLLPKWE